MLGDGQATVAQELREFLTWPGAWTICIWNHGDRLAAHIHSPGGTKLSIVIAEELSSYPVIDAAVYRDGQIYIISLPGESFVGPLALPEVVAHKLGNRVVPILREIEMSRDNMSLLPPKKPSPPAD
jgi:hypothetical protein